MHESAWEITGGGGGWGYIMLKIGLWISLSWGSVHMMTHKSLGYQAKIQHLLLILYEILVFNYGGMLDKSLKQFVFQAWIIFVWRSFAALITKILTIFNSVLSLVCDCTPGGCQMAPHNVASWGYNYPSVLRVSSYILWNNLLCQWSFGTVK